MSDTERRMLNVDELRVDEDDDGKRSIVGHAAVFNSLSEDLGGFREQIAPGAFTPSMKEDDVRALFNHNPDMVLGRNRSGTLQLSEDDRGLAIRISPPDTQLARDLMVSIDRGDISQMSFGFQTISDTWVRGDAGEPDLRTLNKVRLFDVSPVTFPAYPDTDVSVAKRSHERMEREWQNRNRKAIFKAKLKGIGLGGRDAPTSKADHATENGRG